MARKIQRQNLTLPKQKVGERRDVSLDKEQPLEVKKAETPTVAALAQGFQSGGSTTSQTLASVGATQVAKGAQQIAARGFDGAIKTFETSINKLGVTGLRARRKGAGRAANQASPDLFKKDLDGFMQLMASSEVKSACEGHPILAPLKNQLERTLQHVRIRPLPYPFEPCLTAVQEAQDFLKAVVVEMGGTADVKLDPIKTPGTPGEMQAELHELQKADSAFAKQVIKDPMGHYNDFKARIEADGPSAKFPEFGRVLRICELHASDPSVLEACEKSPALAMVRQSALATLDEVKAEGFPYRKTIDAMEKLIGFQDIYDRGREGGTKTPLYHSKRWKYHAHVMKDAAPDYIMFPTTHSLGVAALLKVRGVPLGFVGVANEPMWVDGHSQSPLEFWYHDFNHSRRMSQQFSDRAEELGLSVQQYAERSNKFVQEEMIPQTSIKKSDSDEEKNLKRIMKVLLFEVCHEDALPADPDIIRDSISRAPYATSPFVFEVQSQDGLDIDYEKGPNATVNAFVYRKLAGEFYDQSAMRMTGLGAPEVRTREFVAKSSLALNERLKLGISPEQLKANVLDDSGLPDDFRTKIVKMLEADPTCMAPMCEDAARAAGANV